LTGRVDDEGRALLVIAVRNPTTGGVSPITAWIDTAFSGELVVPRGVITTLSLPTGPAARAVLADGTEVTLDSFTAELEWFGTWRSVEVIGNDGRFPLLGVGLLLGHELHIDYFRRMLTLS
jgi:clan AA aspartic protease